MIQQEFRCMPEGPLYAAKFLYFLKSGDYSYFRGSVENPFFFHKASPIWSMECAFNLRPHQHNQRPNTNGKSDDAAGADAGQHR